METQDHLMLAKWLLARVTYRLPVGFAAGFCLGSVMPDWNPFTYMRGIRAGQGMHGHNAEVTGKRICHLISESAEDASFDFIHGLRLGTTMHYLADAFTYPHHEYYHGTLAGHVAYEAALHLTFVRYTEKHSAPTVLQTESTDFSACLDGMLKQYRKCRKTRHNDCRFITQMCCLAFDTVMCEYEKTALLRENNAAGRALPVAGQPIS